MSSDILVIEPNDDDEYAQDAELDGVEELAQEGPGRNWQLSIAAGIIVSLVLIGETVGGLIGLNNYENLEIGTGVAAIANCDSEVNVKPAAASARINNAQEFKLDYVDISGISDECLNRTFTLSLYKSVGLGLGEPANLGTRMGGSPTNYIKFVLATQPSGFNGLDWKVYPTSNGLPNPPTSSGLSTCGGDNNAVEEIDIPTFDWTDPDNPGFGIVCPDDDFLTHFSGYISFPGTDDGDLHGSTFTLRSTGNAELRIGNKVVISDRQTHSASNKTGTFTHRKGTSYSFDLWYFKGEGEGELSLSWNRNSDGSLSVSSAIVPSTAYSFDNSISIVIPASEGVVDYTVTALEFNSNNRSVRITLGSVVPTTDVDRFTLETSD